MTITFAFSLYQKVRIKKLDAIGWVTGVMMFAHGLQKYRVGVGEEGRYPWLFVDVNEHELEACVK